jgi:hypothetical protein
MKDITSATDTLKDSSKALSLILALMLVGVIAFDVLQQYYYITTFPILDEGQVVTYGELLKSHTIKWLAWTFFSIPLINMVNRHPLLGDEPLTNDLIRHIIYIAVTILCVIALLSIYTVYEARGITSWAEIKDQFVFLFYQKFMTFFMAYLILDMLINFLHSQSLLKGKVMSLKNLKHSYQELYQELKDNKVNDDTRVLHAKVGNKIKAIPVPDIIWIQSDDYCVRVHSSNGTHAIRNSMKAMMKLLPPNFIRVHRQGIVNLHFLKELKMNGQPVIIMKDGNEIPIAKSRLSQVKERLNYN